MRIITSASRPAAQRLEAVTNDAVYASIQDKITEYPTYDEVILDVQAGRLDCMIIDEVYGGYKNAKLGSIFAVSEVDFGDDLYAIGFRKGDAELTQAVNDAINALIESGKAAEISEALVRRGYRRQRLKCEQRGRAAPPGAFCGAPQRTAKRGAEDES